MDDEHRAEVKAVNPYISGAQITPNTPGNIVGVNPYLK
jgi:hypothetical protein